MKTLIRGIGGGFGRVLGRFLCYIFLAFLVYMIINYFDIDIKSIFPIKSILGRYLW